MSFPLVRIIGIHSYAISLSNITNRSSKQAVLSTIFARSFPIEFRIVSNDNPDNCPHLGYNYPTNATKARSCLAMFSLLRFSAIFGLIVSVGRRSPKIDDLCRARADEAYISLVAADPSARSSRAAAQSACTRDSRCCRRQ